MWTKPHIIALDEPTNYLDNETLAALTAALRRFKGGVLTISHNASFVGDVCSDTWRVYQGKVTSSEDEARGVVQVEKVARDVGVGKRTAPA